MSLLTRNRSSGKKKKENLDISAHFGGILLELLFRWVD